MDNQPNILNLVVELIEARATIDGMRDHINTLQALRKLDQADAEIGRIVRRRLVSGNGIPVSRAHVSGEEVNAIDEKYNEIDSAGVDSEPTVE
jgi:hypothetical protein